MTRRFPISGVGKEDTFISGNFFHEREISVCPVFRQEGKSSESHMCLLFLAFTSSGMFWSGIFGYLS